MTILYFVRHAQPDYRTGNDRTFGLSEEGLEDRLAAKKALADIRLDAAVSSPYRRSRMTIEPIAQERGLVIATDERLRERDKGEGSCNTHEMFRKRWADMTFHEQGGECLQETQERNIAAVQDILQKYENQHILVGTHGTALCTICHYYDPSFGYEEFMRVIDYMPWVVRMEFDGMRYVGRTEIAWVPKLFHGVK